MTANSSATEHFKEAQLSWIAVLSQPALQGVLQDLRKPENAEMRAGSDLARLAESNGLNLPEKTKLTSTVGPDDERMGTLCWSWDPDDIEHHPYHCITIRSPIVVS